MKPIRTIIAATLIAASATMAAQPGYAPQSRIVTDSIFSEALNAYRCYTVYLPASFDVQTDKSYPVLYLLHGMTGSNTNWDKYANLKGVADQLTRSGEACEMIIVTPDAGGDPRTHWNGYFNMPGWNYEDFFFNEFMPYIEQTYRVMQHRNSRAVAGLSMGGGGATSYAQRHTDAFSICYAMSALMDLPSMDQSHNPDSNSMVGKLMKSVRDLSCVDYVKNADEATKQQLRSVIWFVDCGDDDFLIDPNIDFYRAMRQAWIPLEFRIRDGVHDWEYWHSALYTALPFVTRNFK